jgi:hypothetical protein
MGTATAPVTTLEKRNAIVTKYKLHFYGPPVLFWNPQPRTPTMRSGCNRYHAQISKRVISQTGVMKCTQEFANS